MNNQNNQIYQMNNMNNQLNNQLYQLNNQNNQNNQLNNQNNQNINMLIDNNDINNNRINLRLEEIRNPIVINPYYIGLSLAMDFMENMSANLENEEICILIVYELYSLINSNIIRIDSPEEFKSKNNIPSYRDIAFIYDLHIIREEKREQDVREQDVREQDVREQKREQDVREEKREQDAREQDAREEKKEHNIIENEVFIPNGCHNALNFLQVCKARNYTNERYRELAHRIFNRNDINEYQLINPNELMRIYSLHTVFNYREVIFLYASLIPLELLMTFL